MNKSGGRGKRVGPKSKYKTNENIKHQKVRVVEGLDNGIYKTSEAIKIAEELGLDLILINEKPEIPICKVLDLNKLIYKEKLHKKKLEEKSAKNITKEIKLTPNIAENDFETKKKKVVEFLKKGYKVKTTVFFKGRQMAFKDKGEFVLAKLADEISEYGIPEMMPKMNGKNMLFILKPKKQK